MTDVCRVVERADGSLVVIHPAPGLDPEEAFARTLEQRPDLAGLPFADVDPATLPDRAQRHAWRLSGGAVVRDKAVPAPADPRAALKAELTQATTVAQLRAAALKLLD